jgi:hypothetical protein
MLDEGRPPTTDQTSTEASAQQRRVLRKLLRDLITFSGVAASDLAAVPRRAPQSKRQRLLYRRADTLTDGEIDMLVSEIGLDRWWSAAERATSPQLPLIAIAAE